MVFPCLKYETVILFDIVFHVVYTSSNGYGDGCSDWLKYFKYTNNSVYNKSQIYIVQPADDYD